MPSFGILGIGGIIAFVIGSVILMDGSHRDISLPMVGGTAAVAGGFILWTAMRLIGLRKQHPVTGPEQISHEHALALDDFEPREGLYHGHVRMSSERWNATSSSPVKTGDELNVMAMEGLTVVVEPEDTTKK